MSTRLLHYHFDNREKLFLAALRFSFEHTGSDIYDAAPPTTPRPGGWPASSTPPCRSTENCAGISRCGRSCGARANRDAESKALAVDLYRAQQGWIGAIRDGIAAGEFIALRHRGASPPDRSLCDGYGIRLVLEDPSLSIDRARAPIWASGQPSRHHPASSPRTDRCMKTSAPPNSPQALPVAAAPRPRRVLAAPRLRLS